MKKLFNSYIECSAIEYWKELCLTQGERRHYTKGDYFFREGEVAPYMGYVETGTLKYVAMGANGEEHVLGFEFAGEFVCDFPFSFRGKAARLSVVAASDCDIVCVPTRLIQTRLEDDMELRDAVMVSTEAIFDTVYNRYMALYTRTPQERYNELISQHPDLFMLFSLRDIASFLNITPTHLSRLRKNI